MTRKTLKLRKLLALVSCAVLLVCVTIAGTVAYLTAQTGTVTNTFTYGNVSFDADAALDEAKVTEYGVKDGDTRVNANTYKLIPGHNYVKDPTVHMSANTEDAWLFVKVVNGIEDIEKNTEDALSIHNQMLALGWKVIDADNGIYYFEEIVGADENIKVFEEFTLKDEIAEDEIDDYVNAQVIIQAYAVQADGFDTANAAWTAAPYTAWTTGA